MRFIFLTVLLLNVALFFVLFSSNKAKQYPQAFKENYGDVSKLSHFTPTKELRKNIVATRRCVRFQGFKDVNEAARFKYLLDDFFITGYLIAKPASDNSGLSVAYVAINDEEADKYLIDRKKIDYNIRLNFPNVSSKGSLSPSHC